MVKIDTSVTLMKNLEMNGLTINDYNKVIAFFNSITMPQLLDHVKTMAINKQASMEGVVSNILAIQQGGAKDDVSMFTVLKVLLLIITSVFSISVIFTMPVDIVQCNMGINLNMIVDDPATFCTPDSDIGVMNKLIVIGFAIPLLMYSGNKMVDTDDVERVFNLPLFRLLLTAQNVATEMEYRERNPGWAALDDMMKGGNKKTRRTNKKQRKTNKNKRR